MYFAIIAQDHPDSLSKRQGARPDHLARLKVLADQGRLLLAGPHPTVASETPTEAGFTGSLIVAQFETQNDAQQWAEADPYVAAGVYANVTVKPFIPVNP